MSCYEMRVYQVEPGKMDTLRSVMHEVMVPLMGEYEMEALGFFATTDDREVRWFVRHESAEAITADWDRFHADARWTRAMAERAGGTPLISGQTSTPMSGLSGLPPLREEQNLQAVGAFSHGLFGERDPAAVDRYVAPGFVNHNSDAAPGPDGVKGFVLHFFGQFPQASAQARRMAAQGDLVFVHSLLSTGPKDRGSALVDIFRLVDGRIAEHWDVMQPLPEKTASGEPMV